MMSVKKMIDLYVRYGIDETTWNMLYEMTCHGLISGDNWVRFSNVCAGWCINGDTIMDGDGSIVYLLDKEGCWQKV